MTYYIIDDDESNLFRKVGQHPCIDDETVLYNLRTEEFRSVNSARVHRLREDCLLVKVTEKFNTAFPYSSFRDRPRTEVYEASLNCNVSVGDRLVSTSLNSVGVVEEILEGKKDDRKALEKHYQKVVLFTD